jgi:uncharacterized membrane protein
MQNVMIYNIKLYLAMLAFFFAVDRVWLGLVAKKFYAKHLGFLMPPDINWCTALIFYLITGQRCLIISFENRTVKLTESAG